MRNVKSARKMSSGIDAEKILNGVFELGDTFFQIRFANGYVVFAHAWDFEPNVRRCLKKQINLTVVTKIDARVFAPDWKDVSEQFVKEGDEETYCRNNGFIDITVKRYLELLNQVEKL